MFLVADETHETYKVKEVAELTGLSVRALHHYDAIGLVSPKRRTSAGYRLYTEADLLALQQVLVYRELGLPLERIKQIVNDPAFDRQAAFQEQRRQLEDKLENTHAMLRAVDKALAALKGEPIMDHKELFDGFDPAEYEEEAKERWGDTDAYKESARRTKRYGPEDWKALKAENDEIMSALAELLAAGASPRTRRRWTSPSATGCTSTGGFTRARTRCTAGSGRCTWRTSASPRPWTSSVTA